MKVKFSLQENKPPKAIILGIESKKLGGTPVDINGSEYKIIPELQSVLTNTHGALIQKLTHDDTNTFRNILKSPNFNIYTSEREKSSCRSFFTRCKLDKDIKIIKNTN